MTDLFVPLPPLTVVIPFRDYELATTDLVAYLRDFDHCLLMDNRPIQIPFLEDFENEEKCTIVHCPDWTLHQMWNHAWKMADGDVCFMNNDIALPAPYHQLQLMQVALHHDPDLYVVSVDPSGDVATDWGPTIYVKDVGAPRPGVPEGGLAGWMFMVKGTFPRENVVDPNLNWWYGDNDVVYMANKLGGKAGYVKGLGVKHMISMTLRDRLGELTQQIKADEAYWRDKMARGTDT